jgi:ribosomal protein L14
MTYVGSLFRVVDNTGVRIVKCISCYKKGFLGSGCLVLLIIKKLKPNNKKKLKKGQKIQGYVLNIKKPFIRKGGHILESSKNSVILLKKNGDLLGSRIKTIVSSELKFLKDFAKVLSLANFVL